MHERSIDQYGYVHFNANFYWIPGKGRGDVKVLQYSKRIKIYCQRELIVEYELAAYGIKNEQISPPGTQKPKYMPQYRPKPTEQEEKKLRNISRQVNDYLDFALKPKGIQKHKFIRELFSLSKKIALPVLIKAIERALKYQITDIKTIERIVILEMNACDYKMPFVEINEDYENRQSYIEGRITDDPDLSTFDKMLDQDE